MFDKKKWIKEYNKKYYIEHRDQKLEKGKEWRIKHRDQHRELSKIWYSTNKEYRMEYLKKWNTSPVSSIYEIKNILTGKKYIGSTSTNPRARWIKHCGASKIESHRPLYKDMMEFGIDNFKFEVLFTCPKDQARKAEQFIIDAYGGELYNKNRACKDGV